MTVLTCAITGKSITLLKEIANSGEAKVWRTNQNGYLAKIYHSPTPERVQKLAVMIANPPTEPNSHLHHVSFAWPKSALKNGQGDCVGFLMPEIKDGKELLDVYNPRRRQALKLQIDWRFLHTTALNIVSIIEALHAAGYVLGDIKPQNILVNNRALPSIIDTDSFQVKNPKNGKVYNCLVGSEGYTPPELIGKDFDSIEQTEVHDRFRLGVIIYQLLFGGNNPFQGEWTGAGETPDINELICQGLWVNGSTNLIAAVARTIPLEIVHPEVQQCFLKCFNDGHKNPNFRPTARKWLEALKVGNDRLTICGRVDNHYYSRTYGKCYWCDRSTKLGVDIFPGVVKAKPSVVVESTIFAATNTLELVKQEGKIITVVGQVANTRHLSSINIFFINFGNVSSLVNGYSPFAIVIFSEGLKNLSNSRSLTITQLSNWVGSYIKITGTLEVHQKSSCNTPQIILKDSNQISLISQTEANNLIVENTNTNTSAAVKQTQSQVTQPAVYTPQNQTVIIQPSGTYTNTNTVTTIQPTQSKAHQVLWSTPPTKNIQNQPAGTFTNTSSAFINFIAVFVIEGLLFVFILLTIGYLFSSSNNSNNFNSAKYEIKKSTFPITGESKGVTFTVKSARYSGGDLLIRVNMQNKGNNSVRFLYGFLDITDNKGRTLSAITEGLPAELPPNSREFSGAISIPTALLDDVNKISLSLTDYPNQKVKLNLVDIPVKPFESQKSTYDELNNIIVTATEDSDKLYQAQALAKNLNIESLLQAIRLAESIKQDSYLYQKSQKLIAELGRNILKLAQEQMDRRNADTALEIARKIPPIPSLQSEIDDFMVLGEAQNSAFIGTVAGLETAISQAQQIDTSRKVYKQAQELIARWQLEIEDLSSRQQ